MNARSIPTHTSTIRALSAAALLGLVSVALVNPAHAATPSGDVAQVVVRYGDLNLASERGSTMLRQRIAAAARQVCPSAYSRDLRISSVGRACQEAAIDRALEQVHGARFAAAATTVTSKQ